MDILWGLIGGLMIGTGGAVLLLGSGRIMGASGLIGGLIDGSGWKDASDRLVFLAAVIAVPALLHLVVPVDTQATTDIALLVLGGLAVGVGTRIANGCTSGHGVCGISRLSLRGIVATCVYIGAGVVIVALMRLVMGV